MKPKFIFTFAFRSISFSASGQVKDIPFSRGFNLYDWFEKVDDIAEII